jgi:hypothetical protein
MSMLPTSKLLPAIGFTCLAVHGCTSITGGAVEVSWGLRASTGTAITCATSGVDSIRLWWEVASSDADGAVSSTRRFDQFPCGDARGITGFDLPVGTASLWLSPVCEGDREPAAGTYRAPAPIVRTITEGDVITLDTQVIELDEGACE